MFNMSYEESLAQMHTFVQTTDYNFDIKTTETPTVFLNFSTRSKGCEFQDALVSHLSGLAYEQPVTCISVNSFSPLKRYLVI